MSEHEMNRRAFLKAIPGAGTAIAGAPAILAQRSPNDVIGAAIIGVGVRGHYILQEIQEVPRTEVRVISDLYAGYRERAKRLCTNPKMRFVQDWEKAMADPDIDAVFIVTPDFCHAPMTIRAAELKKDIYVEKGWCTNLAEAKRMRKAVKESKVVMQLGHHYNGSPFYHKAKEIYRSGELGKVTVVRSYIDRTSDFRFWKFYGDYNDSIMPKDAGPDTIDWERWIANAPTKRPFEADRFFTWRCWWDYGTGIAGDLMSHIWDGINMVMGMGIPESAMTQGGTYFWKGDRDVPDMWHVIYDYPSKDLAITFGCDQTNSFQGEITQILGRDKTMEVSEDSCRTYVAQWKPEYRNRQAEARKKAEELGLSRYPVQPDYEMKKGELQVTNHMEDFFNCMRTRELPRCHVDRAFQEAAAISMSVESYRRGRRVQWDAASEEIV